MAWKNIEETRSAPRLVHTQLCDLVYVSMCEVVRCVCVWTCVCHRAVCLYGAAVLSFLPNRNNTYCFYRSSLRCSFPFSACFKSVSDIRGIPLWLCNMIWGEHREREGEVCLAGFHVLLCAHISQPRFTVVGSVAYRRPPRLFPSCVACFNLSCVL